MAHNKVYGICESKCKVEVYAKSTLDTKLDKINTKIATETEHRQNADTSIKERLSTLELWKEGHEVDYENLDSALASTNQNVDTLFSELNALKGRVKALEG